MNEISYVDKGCQIIPNTFKNFNNCLSHLRIFRIATAIIRKIVIENFNSSFFRRFMKILFLFDLIVFKKVFIKFLKYFQEYLSIFILP